MNQWPGVRLRVTEGWDEEGHHSFDSLHYEGRAVDVTTSDRDRSKYGMLARLAVEAGFDWVYYEGRAHIHCSVKSETSDPAKYGGCFSGDSTIRTSTGKRKKLSELQVGEKVLSMDTSTNKLVFSEVLLFMDWDPHQRQHFLKLDMASGRTLTVTPSHLVLTGSVNYSKPVYASTLTIGSPLIVYNTNGNILKDIIVKVTSVFRTGIFAPLTAVGTIIINDILTSCYAVFDSHLIAHWTFAPLRIIFKARDAFIKIFKILEQPLVGWAVSVLIKPVIPTNGVHWYPKAFYHIGNYLMPWRMHLK